MANRRQAKIVRRYRKDGRIVLVLRGRRIFLSGKHKESVRAFLSGFRPSGEARS